MTHLKIHPTKKRLFIVPDPGSDILQNRSSGNFDLAGWEHCRCTGFLRSFLHFQYPISSVAYVYLGRSVCTIHSLDKGR